MTMPAARPTDATAHGTPALPGTGCTKVRIGGLYAWRTVSDTHDCPTPLPPNPHGPEKCYVGSLNVLIDGKMAVRLGDVLLGAGPPNAFAAGCPTVKIGTAAFGLADRANMDEY
jgi:uncharacterized Zn-binding protein involved in type VI secretion